MKKMRPRVEERAIDCRQSQHRNSVNDSHRDDGDFDVLGEINEFVGEMRIEHVPDPCWNCFLRVVHISNVQLKMPGMCFQVC